MASRTIVRAPREFGDFCAIYCDENYDLSLSHEDALRKTVELLQFGDRIKVIRNFLDSALATLDEGMLRSLWMSTSPQVAFGGDGEPYREFFTLARDLMTKVLETEHRRLR